MHVPKAQARLADLLPRLDPLSELDGRLNVRVAEVADADDSAANEFVERVSYPAQRRLPDRASLDGEDGVAARGVVLEDVDRLVVTGPQPGISEGHFVVGLRNVPKTAWVRCFGATGQPVKSSL